MEKHTGSTKKTLDRIIGGVLFSVAVIIFIRGALVSPDFVLPFLLGCAFVFAGEGFLIAAPIYNKSALRSLVIFLMMLSALCVIYWTYLLTVSLQTIQIERQSNLLFLTMLGVAPLMTIFLYLTFGGAITALRNLTKVFRAKGIKDIVISFLVFYPLTIFFFALFNGTIYKFKPDSFQPSEGLSLFDFIYYSVVTITTLGYGDIRPLHWATRLLSMVEVVIGIVLIVVYVGISASVVLREESKKRRK